MTIICLAGVEGVGVGVITVALKVNSQLPWHSTWKILVNLIGTFIRQKSARVRGQREEPGKRPSHL